MLKRVLKRELRPLCWMVGDLAYRPKSKPPEFNEYQLPAVDFYGRPQLLQLHADPPGQKAAEKMLRRSMLGADVPEDDVLAGYIYPPRWLRDTLVHPKGGGLGWGRLKGLLSAVLCTCTCMGSLRASETEVYTAGE